MRLEGSRVEIALGFVALASLGVGIVLVLLPFLSALLWGAILAYACWPLFARLETGLGGRTSFAAAITTLLLAVAFVLPLVLVGTQTADGVAQIMDTLRSLLAMGPPEPPDWLFDVPLLGPWLVEGWNRMASNTQSLPDLVQPWLATIRDVGIGLGLQVGSGLLELTLSVLAAFFFFRDGPGIVAQARAAGERILGGRAQHLLEVAGSTIRGVVYGLVGTALVQGGLAALGFALVGIQGALVLGVLTFFLGLLPAMGPPLVWGPLAVWLAVQDRPGAGLFLGLYGLFLISGVDNFLRPYLISRGSNLSFLVTFLGVIGGALAFGFLGIFIGPVLLALGQAVLKGWIQPDEPQPAEPQPADPG